MPRSCLFCLRDDKLSGVKCARCCDGASQDSATYCAVGEVGRGCLGEPRWSGEGEGSRHVGISGQCTPGSRHRRLVSLPIFTYLVTLSISLSVSLSFSFPTVDRDGESYMPVALDDLREQKEATGVE